MLKPYSANPMDLPQAIGFNLEYQHFHNNIFLQKYLGRVAELVHLAFLPAGRAQRLVLRLLCCFRVCIYVRPHLSRAQIITSRTLLPCDLRLRQFRRLLCVVAAMSSLPQLRLRDGYREAEAT